MMLYTPWSVIHPIIHNTRRLLSQTDCDSDADRAVLDSGDNDGDDDGAVFDSSDHDDSDNGDTDKWFYVLCACTLVCIHRNFLRSYDEWHMTMTYVLKFSSGKWL